MQEKLQSASAPAKKQEEKPKKSLVSLTKLAPKPNATAVSTRTPKKKTDKTLLALNRV